MLFLESRCIIHHVLVDVGIVSLPKEAVVGRGLFNLGVDSFICPCSGGVVGGRDMNILVPRISRCSSRHAVRDEEPTKVNNARIILVSRKPAKDMNI